MRQCRNEQPPVEVPGGCCVTANQRSHTRTELKCRVGEEAMRAPEEGRIAQADLLADGAGAPARRSARIAAQLLHHQAQDVLRSRIVRPVRAGPFIDMGPEDHAREILTWVCGLAFRLLHAKHRGGCRRDRRGVGRWRYIMLPMILRRNALWSC